MTITITLKLSGAYPVPALIISPILVLLFYYMIIHIYYQNGWYYNNDLYGLIPFMTYICWFIPVCKSCYFVIKIKIIQLAWYPYPILGYFIKRKPK